MRHALERRIEGPLLDSERVGGRLVDPLGDGVPVLRARTVEDLQDEQVEGALEAVVVVFRHS